LERKPWDSKHWHQRLSREYNSGPEEYLQFIRIILQSPTINLINQKKLEFEPQKEVDADQKGHYYFAK